MTEIKTAYLGQFTEDDARAVARELESAGMAWWYKQPGRLTQIISSNDWGIRLFAQEDRLDEARTIAEDITGHAPK